MRFRFAPIDLDRDVEICARFRRDALIASFGTDEEFERGGGATAYIDWLRNRAAELPEGIVHVWGDDEIVGQVEFRVRKTPSEAHVNLVYLVPRMRGSGLGVLVHAYVVSVLRELEIPTATLWVSPSNLRARRYYAKHGWLDLGPQTGAPSAPERADLHLMQLRLESLESLDSSDG